MAGSSDRWLGPGPAWRPHCDWRCRRITVEYDPASLTERSTTLLIHHRGSLRLLPDKRLFVKLANAQASGDSMPRGNGRQKIGTPRRQRRAKKEDRVGALPLAQLVLRRLRRTSRRRPVNLSVVSR